jgi:pimeloyl-ACP methyl ester carboxylesterase
MPRWKQVSRFRVITSITGAIWALKGMPSLLDGVVLEGETRDQRLTITPFPQPGQYANWEPYRQTIETAGGVLVAERHDPLVSFAGLVPAVALAHRAGLERLAALSAPRLGAFIANNSVICSVWPVAPVAPPPALAAGGAPTVLIVGATGDPATPLEAGRRMQRVLGNARLLVVDADRHTSFISGNQCVDDAVTRYLIDRAVPPRGARC